jgi:D-alanyl-D-alanine carboxypeptidase/D-alanyl-D-alanine-endopeptidase (penicillin-binding protein 4)
VTRHLAAAFSAAIVLTSQSAAQSDLTRDLDEIFNDPIFARATIGVRVESLATGQLLYHHDTERLVMPASNMKVLTMAAAAARLGWDFQYETPLDAAGELRDGTLHGDLIVTGAGDPTIGSGDAGPSAVFLDWADALLKAGIRRVNGRIIGDDNAFDDQAYGAGWAWDYLNAGYAAPSGALSYDENVAVVRVRPGPAEGAPASVEISPSGHTFEIRNEATTGAAGSSSTAAVVRTMGSRILVVRGRVPAGGNGTSRTTTIENPTGVFVETLRLTLASRGVAVSGGASDIDDVVEPPTGARRPIAVRRSVPLSALAGRFMKSSQNFYGEMLMKTVGRRANNVGTDENGRRAVRDTLVSWGIPAEAFVVYDGSGLSRYNYVSASTMVAVFRKIWEDDSLRGPFLALLPIGGRDGTLGSRMKQPPLFGRVQAKTGTIANVRALSGYLTTESGEKLVFSMIANVFTVSSGRVDELVERALARLVSGQRAEGTGQK